MKQTKRILAIALALALGLAVMVPAVAAAPVQGGPFAPIITMQPDVLDRVTIGDTLIVEIEAVLPDGVTGELSYNWQWGMVPILQYPYGPIATGPKFELIVDWDTVVHVQHVCVAVINTYIDENNEEQIAYTTANFRLNTYQVEERGNGIAWWEWLLFIPLAPFIIPFALIGAMIFGLGWVGPLLIPLGLLGVVSRILEIFGIAI